MRDTTPHTANEIALPADAPSWARALFKEVRLTRLEMETLREAIGVHVVSRKEAARILGKSTKTLGRWEERGILERVNVSAPGVYYDFERILELKRHMPQ